ncbi:Zonadhesin [Manis javanica]|nr:Zonadhesin [Manis javanica]
MPSTSPVPAWLPVRTPSPAVSPAAQQAVSVLPALCLMTPAASVPLPAVASTATTTISMCHSGTVPPAQNVTAAGPAVGWSVICLSVGNTVCQLKNSQYGCHPYGTATCFVCGDPHYLTFDGRHFSFMGKCTYILAQSCGSSTELFFRVTVKNETRGKEGVSCVSKVFITLPQTTVTLLKDRHVLVKGQQVALPAIPSKGVLLAASGRFVELQRTFGLRVRQNGDQQLFLSMSSTYSRKLCVSVAVMMATLAKIT